MARGSPGQGSADPWVLVSGFQKLALMLETGLILWDQALDLLKVLVLGCELDQARMMLVTESMELGLVLDPQFWNWVLVWVLGLVLWALV